MSWDSQYIVANQVIVEGGNDGVFVYSGTPALGNLIVSAAAMAGTDPYGNTYPAGLDVQNGGIVEVDLGGGRFVKLSSSAQQGAGILFQPPNEPGHTWTRGIVTGDYDVGTGKPIMQVHSPFDAGSVLAQPRAIWDLRGDDGSNAGTRIDGILDVLNISSANAAAGCAFTLSGNMILGAAGNELKIKEGSNASMGTAILAGGTATVNTTLVTANSRIFLTAQSTGGTPGALRVSARTPGTSFVITSTSATDTSTVAWHIVEPA